MEAVPLVMRVIRAEMRVSGGRFASVPQLRALGLVHRHPGASLTDVATHLGVTPATASVLVDRLVRRGLLHRDAHPHERRRIRLSLTRTGSRHLRQVRAATRRRLEAILTAVPARDRAAISAGVLVLRHAFGSRRSVSGGE
jgi:DNA-binding MarR family transcriptional regulator